MSELAVGQLKGLTVNSNVITVPTGHTIKQAGAVLQVLSTHYTGTISTTATTPIDVPGFSVSITPKFSTSTILVMVSVAFGFVNDAYPYILVARNGTSIGTGVNATGVQSNTFLSGTATALGTPNDYRFIHAAKNFLDSPATTSALTYQIKFASPYAGYAGYINRQNNQSNNVFIQYPSSTITVMEIAQ